MTGADSLYHRLFSHPLMVGQLVQDFLSDVLPASVDVGAMENITAKLFADSGERREGDVIWRLPTGDGDDVYLYLMIEFQTRTDPWMPLRTLVYQGLLWQRIVSERMLTPGRGLPPLLLTVLYNGEPRWSAPLDLSALLALPPDSALRPWQPRARYHLLDMGAFSDADLLRRQSLAALLFRLERRQEPETLTALIGEVVAWFRAHPDYGEVRRVFNELVTQAIKGVGVSVPIPGDMVEMKTMLESLGEIWREQWKAEGLAAGLAKGRAEGLEEGRVEGLEEGRARALLRLLERRFGPLPEDQRARVLTAGSDTLDLWLDRVLDAPTLDAVFERR
ncbi:MAG: transposase [Alphaproteobacteria bacterium]|jgi:hypothetical protein|nr:transposase [Alphaproteobacteria bacterium]